jgi:hypothetical protein
MLVTASVPRKISFLVILIPAILVVIFTDVNLASRVFPGYFLIQALLAGLLARRSDNWWAVAGFAGIGVVMAIILIFGLPL